MKEEKGQHIDALEGFVFDFDERGKPILRPRRSKREEVEILKKKLQEIEEKKKEDRQSS